MKTDELVTMLATGAAPVAPEAAHRSYATSLGWGALAATLLMAIFLGVRRDLAQAILLPMFWVKLAYVAALAAAALVATVRLSVPGGRLGRMGTALLTPVVAMWLLAAIVLLEAPPGEREALFFGRTWRTCPVARRAALRAGVRRRGLGDEAARAHPAAPCGRRGRIRVGRHRRGDLRPALPRAGRAVPRVLVPAGHHDPDDCRRAARPAAAALVSAARCGERYSMPAAPRERVLHTVIVG